MDFNDVFFNPKDFILTDEKIGEGTFGQVYVIVRKSDNKRFAAKIIKTNYTNDGREQKMLMDEIELLWQVDHAAILKLIGINLRSLKNPMIYQPTIITELLKNGSLDHVISKQGTDSPDPNWTSTKKYICLLGIAHAMKYLHEQGILHRDLKPANVLIDMNYYPKVADFGISKCFDESLEKSMDLSVSVIAGSPLYMPPEYLKGRECTPSVDVYAFGITAYEIITGKSGLNMKFTNDMKVPKKTQELIERCCSCNVSDRPSFEEIFELLSNDFSYSPEPLFEKEVEVYIQVLKGKMEYDELETFVLLCKQEDELIKVLHSACETENIKIVKLILGNRIIDVNASLVFLPFFLFMQFKYQIFFDYVLYKNVIYKVFKIKYFNSIHN